MANKSVTARRDRYAVCIDASRRVRWETDRDVIRGRSFELSRKFLPDGLAMIERFGLHDADERRLVSQIQGRTYANMFGLVERFIGAKMLDVTRTHWLGNQTALEALVRFTDEELKHQALFRRLETMMDACMPAGYTFLPEPNAVAGMVLGKSTWSVLALTCMIELMTQAHYRQSIEPDAGLSELWKEVFLFHWREEAQHAIIDEMEWQREDERLDIAARERAVDDLIALVSAVDGMLRMQADSDAGYFAQVCGRSVAADELSRISAAFLAACRWQYIVSGAQEPRFKQVLADMISGPQNARIGAALAPILDNVAAPALRRAA